MGKINTKTLNKHIATPHKLNSTTIANVIREWFAKNGLISGDCYVETRQGLKIHFTGISEWHFAKDVMDSKYKDVALKAVTYLPEVFESGQYTAIQPLTKDRKGKRAEFVRFHLFRKQVQIGDNVVTIKAKAGEYPNGKIVLLPKLTSYTFYLAKVKNVKGSVADFHIPLPNESLGPATILKISREPKSATLDYDNVSFDSIQADLSTFEIESIEPVLPIKLIERQLIQRLSMF